MTSIAGSRVRNTILAGLLAAGAVLAWLSDVFYGPYLYPTFHPFVSRSFVFIIAAGVGVMAALSSLALPRAQAGLLWVLAATGFVLLSWKCLTNLTGFEVSRLPLTPDQQYWAIRGPGEGILGLLPATLAVLIGGRWLFGLTLREQWNGRLLFHWRDLLYGGLFAVVLSGLMVAAVALSGAARIAWEPNWAGHGVNLASNLYEEILARGLLLQVSRKAFGNVFAAIWTGIFFGAMHGFTWFGLVTALGGWVLALPVLWAGSLWAGWVFHQGIDFILDSLLH
jgi:membrane protease YdiL (CAAX protease family)